MSQRQRVVRAVKCATKRGKIMTTAKVNRVHIFFNAEHMPYMYGAVHIVDGGVDNQW